MEQLILAFTKEETTARIRRMLEGSGYTVRAAAHSAPELYRHLANADDVLVVMGYKIGTDTVDDVFDALRRGQKLMSVVKAERQDMIDNEEIFVLPLPINRERLLSSIEVFLGAIKRETKRTSRRSGDEEEIIERAKLYLMEKYRMTEQQAHRFIQKRSMDTGAKFIDTARQILHI